MRALLLRLSASNPTLHFLVTVGLWLLLPQASLWAQPETQTDLVEVSGIVVADAGGQMVPVPFTAIGVKGSSRGVSANYRGMFTIVARRGETLIFSALGYETQEFVIPNNTQGQYLTIAQVMVGTAYELPETVIFPWPDRDHLRIEFLAMKPNMSAQLEDIAERNLSPRRLAEVGLNMAMDGSENRDFLLRQQARSYYTIGQTPPAMVFNPMAWGQFFQAWKRGDFKKKKPAVDDEY
jgi:hypothetical protein